MSSEWSRALLVSYETGRLYLPSPEGNSSLVGIRDARYPFSLTKELDESIFCLGGSTTYGVGVEESKCWPALIQTPQRQSMNCGMVNNDLKASLHSLVSLFKNKFVPRTLIFFDGVNEKNAYQRWLVNQNSYVDFDCQFFQFQHYFHKNDFDFSRLDFLFATLLGSRYFKLKYHLQKNEPQNELSALATLWKIIQRISAGPRGRSLVRELALAPEIQDSFIDFAALSYLNSKSTIKRIASSFGIEECYFFLQPHIGTVDSNFSTTSRSIYMEKLYSKITAADIEVIDISNRCNKLNSSMFFDWQHFDERGHNIVAETIKMEISKVR